MIVYIAGPITGILNYKDNFMRIEEELKKRGHAVLNPANLPTGLKDYMPICKAMLDQADAAFFLEGWKKSKGSNEEREYCVDKEEMYIFEEEDLGEDWWDKK